MSFMKKGTTTTSTSTGPRASTSTSTGTTRTGKISSSDRTAVGLRTGTGSISSSSSSKISNTTKMDTTRKDSGTIFITSGTGVIGYRVALSLLEAGVPNVRVGVWNGDTQQQQQQQQQQQTGSSDDNNDNNVNKSSSIAAASCTSTTTNSTSTSEKEGFAVQIRELLTMKGAHVIEFDWNNTTSYTDALHNVTTIFCTIPHMENWADVFPSFIKQAKECNVQHFVKVSFLRNNDIGDRYRANVPFVRFHSTCDDLLEQSCKVTTRPKTKTSLSTQTISNNNSTSNIKNNNSTGPAGTTPSCDPSSTGTNGMLYTILACSHLMSTPLLHQGTQLTEERKFVTASYGMGVNYVSPNDIADAAVVVLLNRIDHANKTYNLTGRTATFDSDVAKLLSTKYGTTIQHIELGYHEYKKNIKARGLPSWLVKDSAEFERMKASGIDELITSYTTDLETLIGKKPESFQEYLDNTSTMRPGMRYNLP